MAKNQQQVVSELTVSSILIGIIIGVIMTAANVYLGLYAGMTVSASIPAAVIGLGIYRGILRKSGVLESNIVQTMASSGESLAAGVIFTIPALILVGAWENFKFWPTTLIAIAGGLLGIVFMIPMRKALIINDKNLTYPEGVACAAVLEAGEEGASKKGLFTILKGLMIGGLFKFLSTGIGFLKGSVEVAGLFSGRAFFAGSDISPALLAVGYIVNLEVATLVFAGGLIGWLVGIPLLGVPADMTDASALDIAWTLWSTQVRYLGVGAMIVGGLWSIYSVRSGIAQGLKEVKGNYSQAGGKVTDRRDRDLGISSIMTILAVAFMIMVGVYDSLIGSLGLSIMTAAIMVVLAFIFVAVSSYVVGLVGSSNNPVSGMTISALLATAAFFLVLGFKGDNAILATLGVAAVVCCAACASGDMSQDLKTGHLVGATPRSQQIAQIIGVIIPALVIAPVLTLLHSAYGIGTGLKAPQATLFASLTKGLFGTGTLPYNMIVIGMALGVVVIAVDHLFLSNRKGFRLHLMPLAVGIYLPVTLAVPIFLGGLIRKSIEKVQGTDDTDNGVLLSSGLIAGEAIMGVALAIVLYMNINLKMDILSHTTSELVSVAALMALAIYLWKVARKA